jgi:outer membrane protein assembly factor BamB
LLALLLLVGCSARTTGATNISNATSRTAFFATVQLNGVGSCSEHCTFYMRWRKLGAAAWTNGPQHSVGKIDSTRWHETVTPLENFENYEYQTCGKEDSWSGVVCVGPDGTPGSTQKFKTNAGSTDWPQFGYDERHGSSNPFELTLDAGNVSQLDQSWYGLVREATSPSVLEGIVYVGGRRLQSGRGLLAAYPVGCRIDGGQCTRLWTADAGSSIKLSTPAAGSGRVFIGSEDGDVHAFNATNGSPVWRASTGGPIRSAPLRGLGLVYVGSEDGNVYAFSQQCGSGGATCAPFWKTPTFGAITSSPTIGDGPGGTTGLYVGSVDHHLYAMNASQGGVLWAASTGGPIRSSPTVANGVVYVGSDDGKVYAFQTGCSIQFGTCGNPTWTATTGGPITASPAVADRDFGITLYVGSTDGKLYAYSASCDVCPGGQLLWKGATGGAITSRPAVANGVVYVGSEDGNLYAFDADGCGAPTCQPLFTARTAGSPISPAVAGGEVYVGDRSGVRAYGLP